MNCLLHIFSGGWRLFLKNCPEGHLALVPAEKDENDNALEFWEMSVGQVAKSLDARDGSVYEVPCHTIEQHGIRLQCGGVPPPSLRAFEAVLTRSSSSPSPAHHSSYSTPPP